MDQTRRPSRILGTRRSEDESTRATPSLIVNPTQGYHPNAQPSNTNRLTDPKAHGQRRNRLRQSKVQPTFCSRRRHLPNNPTQQRGKEKIATSCLGHRTGCRPQLEAIIPATRNAINYITTTAQKQTDSVGGIGRPPWPQPLQCSRTCSYADSRMAGATFATRLHDSARGRFLHQPTGLRTPDSSTAPSSLGGHRR